MLVVIVSKYVYSDESPIRREEKNKDKATVGGVESASVYLVFVSWAHKDVSEQIKK